MDTAAGAEVGTGDPAVAETLTAAARTTDPAEVIRLTAAGTRQVNERQATSVTPPEAVRPIAPGGAVRTYPRGGSPRSRRHVMDCRPSGF